MVLVVGAVALDSGTESQVLPFRQGRDSVYQYLFAREPVWMPRSLGALKYAGHVHYLVEVSGLGRSLGETRGGDSGLTLLAR